MLFYFLGQKNKKVFIGLIHFYIFNILIFTQSKKHINNHHQRIQYLSLNFLICSFLCCIIFLRLLNWTLSLSFLFISLVNSSIVAWLSTSFSYLFYTNSREEIDTLSSLTSNEEAPESFETRPVPLFSFESWII